MRVAWAAARGAHDGPPFIKIIKSSDVRHYCATPVVARVPRPAQQVPYAHTHTHTHTHTHARIALRGRHFGVVNIRAGRCALTRARRESLRARVCVCASTKLRCSTLSFPRFSLSLFVRLPFSFSVLVRHTSISIFITDVCALSYLK